MQHFIIVKFKNNYNFINEIDRIKQLFNESLKIDGIKKVKIYVSNSKLNNRHDLMINMELLNLQNILKNVGISKSISMNLIPNFLIY